MKTFNLDCEITVNEFISQYANTRGRQLANLLDIHGKLAVKKANSISNYAWNKYVAIKLRKNGDISKAMEYEKICDKIYNGMSNDVKW